MLASFLTKFHIDTSLACYKIDDSAAAKIKIDGRLNIRLRKIVKLINC